MKTDTANQANAISYYHRGYHIEHYKQVLDDDLNYRLLSLYWKYILFTKNGLDTTGRILDFGSGLGQVSAALTSTTCFDLSSFAIEELRKRKRTVIENRADIPERAFDCVLSSHALEHSLTPHADLRDFGRYVQDRGHLVLVLPVEMHLEPTLQSDWNQHVHAWTFQTITNLLLQTGWTPLFQSTIYGPYLLRTLGRRISASRAVRAAYALGKLRRQGRSMLTIARVGE